MMALPEMKYPLSREQLLDLYYFMKLTRELDEQLVRLFRQNKVVGGLYSSIGQEASAIGTATRSTTTTCRDSRPRASSSARAPRALSRETSAR